MRLTPIILFVMVTLVSCAGPTRSADARFNTYLDEVKTKKLWPTYRGEACAIAVCRLAAVAETHDRCSSDADCRVASSDFWPKGLFRAVEVSWWYSEEARRLRSAAVDACGPEMGLLVVRHVPVSRCKAHSCVLEPPSVF